MLNFYSQWSLLGGNDTTLGSKNYPMTCDRLMRILLLPGHSIWSRMGIVGSNEALSLGISLGMDTNGKKTLSGKFPKL